MTETEYRKSIIKTCLDYRDYLESELKQAYGDGIVGTAEISEQSRHFMRHSDKLITREELESNDLTLIKEDTMNFKRR